jgi:HK97 family phage portal protein
MKIFDMLRGRNEQRDADQSWNALATGSNASTAGAYVDAKSAEFISAVYACVQALSESTACLPLHVYRRTDTGDRERADGHWLSRLLDRPNNWQTGMEFRESQLAAVLLHGNAYARKDFNSAGEVIALHPMHPLRVAIVRVNGDNYRYDYTDESGAVSRLLSDEVLHLRDRTEPGSIVGKSRIAIARETLGLTLSLRAHGAGVFGRGARPASVITNEGTRDLTETELLAMHGRLEQYATPQNAGKTLIMPRNMKYQTVGLSNEDAEWLQAMQFSVTEICRLFRVPPTLIAELTHATFSNITELGLQFARFSLQRWITCWEESISYQLLGPIARSRFYAEHSLEGLLRAQPAERAAFYKSGIDAGWLDAAEVRKLENLPQRAVDDKSLAAG